MNVCSLITAFLVPNLHGSIPSALQQIRAQCAHMHENQMVCLRVHQRLQAVWQALQFVPTARVLAECLPVLGTYGELLVRFLDMLARFSVDDAVFRLMLSRQFFVKMSELHREIGFVFQMVSSSGQDENADDGAVCMHSLLLWEIQWGADRKVQQLLDTQRSGYTAVARKELSAIDAEVDVLCEVKAALADAVVADTESRSGGPTSSVVVIFVAADADAASEAVRIAKWAIIHGDDVSILEERSVIESVNADALRKSACRVSKDVANADYRSAGNTEESWVRSKVQRCRLIRSHSACHLCTPVYFAFEDLETMSKTVAYLSDHSEQLAQLFYKVEMSLHFPHEQHVFGSGDDALSVCEFGFANLSLGGKKSSDDTKTTQLKDE